MTNEVVVIDQEPPDNRKNTSAKNALKLVFLITLGVFAGTFLTFCALPVGCVMLLSSSDDVDSVSAHPETTVAEATPTPKPTPKPTPRPTVTPIPSPTPNIAAIRQSIINAGQSKDLPGLKLALKAAEDNGLTETIQEAKSGGYYNWVKQQEETLNWMARDRQAALQKAQVALVALEQQGLLHGYNTSKKIFYASARYWNPLPVSTKRDIIQQMAYVEMDGRNGVSVSFTVVDFYSDEVLATYDSWNGVRFH